MDFPRNVLSCICRRIILLETVAGVPGMVGAMTRHFHSLRRLKRDHGWIHTLLGKISQHCLSLFSVFINREHATCAFWARRLCLCKRLSHGKPAARSRNTRVWPSQNSLVWESHLASANDRAVLTEVAFQFFRVQCRLGLVLLRCY